jgi:uncharacterized protein HemX
VLESIAAATFRPTDIVIIPGGKSLVPDFGESMKRLSACLLLVLLSLAFTVPSHAQGQTHYDPNKRAYRKAAKKVQKDMARYNKQQQKARKKAAKAQRKALERAQRNSMQHR